MFLNIKKEDLSLVNEMLGKINCNAKDIFNQSYKSGNIYKGFVYLDQSDRGVFTIIEGDLYYSLQVSFDRDVSDYKIIKFIEDEIKHILNIRKSKDVYLNFNGYNVTLINYFMDLGFVRDTIGFEYYISENSDKVKGLRDFTVRDDLLVKRFEEEHALKYLKLLDDAFRKQNDECNEEQDGFSNKHEYNIAWLKKVNKQKNFGAFWDGSQLVGVCILDNDCIDIVAVHPDYQSKGYGSEILKYCIKNRVSNNKYKEIYLRVYFQNRKAQKLYIKNGFTIRGFYCENTYES